MAVVYVGNLWKDLKTIRRCNVYQKELKVCRKVARWENHQRLMPRSRRRGCIPNIKSTGAIVTRRMFSEYCSPVL